MKENLPQTVRELRSGDPPKPMLLVEVGGTESCSLGWGAARGKLLRGRGLLADVCVTPKPEDSLCHSVHWGNYWTAEKAVLWRQDDAYLAVL